MNATRYLRERMGRIDVDEKGKEFAVLRDILLAVNHFAVVEYQQENLFKSIIEEIYCGVKDHNPLIVATWVNSCRP